MTEDSIQLILPEIVRIIPCGWRHWFVLLAVVAATTGSLLPQELEVERFNQAGIAALRAGQPAAAKGAFEQALSLDPSSSALRVNLGLALLKLGDARSAAIAFEEALRGSPDSVAALVNLASLRLSTGSASEALPLLRRALALEPQDQQIRRMAAHAAVETGSKADAEAALSIDLGCESTDPLGRRLLAQRWDRLALREFEREAACRPESLEAALGEATALMELSRPEEAVQRLLGKSPDLRRNKYVLWTLAGAYERLLNFEKAFEQYATAIDTDPNDRRSYLQLGTLALKADIPQLADKVFLDAADRFPEAIDVKLGRVFVSYLSGDYAEALKRCDQVVELDPRFPQARLLRATLLIESGRRPDALADIQIVIQQLPTHPMTRYLHAATLLESESARSDSTRLAMERLAESVETSAGFVDGRLLLARYYREVGDLPGSERQLRAAIDADPASRQARYLLAQVLLESGDTEQARIELARSEQLKEATTRGRRLFRQLLYGGFKHGDGD